MSRAILWFRHDLRLTDNPALQAACRAGELIPVYILDPAPPWQLGGAAQVWLQGSLQVLDQSLQALGSRLLVRRGPAAQVLRELIAESGAGQVFWNRVYEPALVARDTQLKAELHSQGLEVRSFNSALLFEPWQIQTQTGGPYKVFTPFWRKCLQSLSQVTPQAAPESLPGLPAGLQGLAASEWGLLPRIAWHLGLQRHWQIGEAAAQARLQSFLQTPVSHYDGQRDLPAVAGTSQLSPHLRFGEISPRQIWAAALSVPENEGRRRFLAEIGWREFAYHVLYHFPDTPTEPMDARFRAFPWSEHTDNPDALRKWQCGQTGYPIVDAGMRQLWATGWMHNRVRMIVASFLSKDLLLPWQAGAAWFWDTLVDADLASNSLGWQWAAGCGADAAPFFRIFNPITQGQKFDPAGHYVRQWVPELTALPNAWLHQPWAAPPLVLAAAGLELGKQYPQPMVDHAQARQLALAAFAQIKARQP